MRRSPKVTQQSLQCGASLQGSQHCAKVLCHTTVTLAISEYAVVPPVFAQSAKRDTTCIVCRNMAQSACSPSELGGHRCRCQPIRISCDMANESSLPARFWMPGSKARQHCSLRHSNRSTRLARLHSHSPADPWIASPSSRPERIEVLQPSPTALLQFSRHKSAPVRVLQ